MSTQATTDTGEGGDDAEKGPENRIDCHSNNDNDKRPAARPEAKPSVPHCRELCQQEEISTKLWRAILGTKESPRQHQYKSTCKHGFPTNLVGVSPIMKEEVPQSFGARKLLKLTTDHLRRAPWCRQAALRLSHPQEGNQPINYLLAHPSQPTNSNQHSEGPGNRYIFSCAAYLLWLPATSCI